MRACRVRRRSGWRHSWMGDDLKRLVEARVTSGESNQMELGAERLRFNDGTGGDRWPSPCLKLICMSPARSGSLHVVFERTYFCVCVDGKKRKEKIECFRRTWIEQHSKSLDEMNLTDLMWVTRQEKPKWVMVWSCCEYEFVTEAKASRFLCCMGIHALSVSLTNF